MLPMVASVGSVAVKVQLCFDRVSRLDWWSNVMIWYLQSSRTDKRLSDPLYAHKLLTRLSGYGNLKDNCSFNCFNSIVFLVTKSLLAVGTAVDDERRMCAVILWIFSTLLPCFPLWVSYDVILTG